MNTFVLVNAPEMELSACLASSVLSEWAIEIFGDHTQAGWVIDRVAGA